MATSKDAVRKAPELIERFVRQLVVTNKAVMLYPSSSEIPTQNATEAVAALGDALEEFSEVTLTVTKQGLYFGESPVFPKQAAYTAFAQELYNRRLAVVRFHSGVAVPHLIAFLTVLKSTPEEVAASGGFESVLWEQGVGTITAVDAQVTLVDQVVSAEGKAQEDASGEAVTRAPRSRERLELTRILGDETAVEDYLTQRYDSDGAPLSVAARQRRFFELAQLAGETKGPTSDEFIRMFSRALWALDPASRHELLDDSLLPDARSSSVLAGAIRRIDLEEIMRLLAQSESGFDARHAGFSRAVRNLVQVSNADRERIAQAATTAMTEAGASGATISAVLAEAVPTRLTIRAARAPRTLDSAASMALRLIDHAPLSHTADAEQDPEIRELRVEAAIGVTEADIIAGLVALAGIESRENRFANIMSALEDTLDALVARGEFETAAEAAATLSNAATNKELTPEQRRRIEKSIGRFCRPEGIREITRALRLYQPGQPEYEAARQLLDTLGGLAIHPLLEQLADEADRAERKALVDLLSKDATRYVSELSSHVSDSRWYFVRNVVAILGTTKSSGILGAMERTLRHGEPRVRRETIRALSTVPDRMAVEMLIAALNDEDAHNVQLAARYLGTRQASNAVSALEQVARGEGRGNRDNGPRVEAIEALGRMGATEALPTLKSLIRKRIIIGGQRARELRTAATWAVHAIEAKGDL